MCVCVSLSLSFLLLSLLISCRARKVLYEAPAIDGEALEARLTLRAAARAHAAFARSAAQIYADACTGRYFLCAHCG